MDKKILAIILGLILLLSACKKSQTESNELSDTQQKNEEGIGSDINSFFSKLGSNIEYKVKYDVKTTSGNKTTSMIQTMALKGQNSVVSFESKSSSTAIYTVDGKSYTCTISGNNKVCFEAQSAQKNNTVQTSTDLRTNWKSYNIVSKGIRTIAGKPAICFSYDVGGNTVENCLSQEGVPVYMKITAKNMESEYMATEYSSSVSDSEFELPVEPTILPSYN